VLLQRYASQLLCNLASGLYEHPVFTDKFVVSSIIKLARQTSGRIPYIFATVLSKSFSETLGFLFLCVCRCHYQETERCVLTLFSFVFEQYWTNAGRWHH
jgi:hypothetical protein